MTDNETLSKYISGLSVVWSGDPNRWSLAMRAEFADWQATVNGATGGESAQGVSPVDAVSKLGTKINELFQNKINAIAQLPVL